MPKHMFRYYEPFVGGGAVFWALANQGRFSEAVIGDTNEELISTFQAIQRDPEPLIQRLYELTGQYYTGPEETFAKMRNEVRKTPERFIFLNKTAFNGLFRVNRLGEFNAPFGRYEKPRICDAANLRLCHTVLNQRPVKIRLGAFEATAREAGPGDVVYFDPPYIPVSATANFTSYTAAGFGAREHMELASFARELVDRGATVIASNADLPIVRQLYKGFRAIRVQARRAINSKGDKRGPVGELLLVGKKS